MEEKADLLAMGTAAGTVLIYSTAKGALHCTLVSLKLLTFISLGFYYTETDLNAQQGGYCYYSSYVLFV